MKRYLLFIVCTVLLVLMAVLSLSAESDIPIKSFLIELPDFRDPAPSPTDAELILEIANAAENFAQSVDISKYNISYPGGTARLTECYNSVRYGRVDMFWLSSSYGISVNASNIIVKLNLIYSETKPEADANKLLIEASANKAMETVLPYMTDIEKAIVIHDYLALNGEYDYERYLTYVNSNNNKDFDLPASSYNLKGILINKIGVCQSYAYAYKYILKKLGVECDLVSSAPMNHMWNIVKIDGQWYHVDVTWDDPTWDRFGKVNHNFFLCSDADFQTSNNKHSAIHEQWNAIAECTSTIYDDAVWTDSSSAIVFDSENMYISHPDGKIVSYDRDDYTNKATVYTVTDKWMITGTQYYPGSFAKIAIYNSRIYLNLSREIISMACDGTDIKTEFNSPVNIWGIVLDDNLLYYTTVNDYYDSSLKALPSTGNITIGSVELASILIQLPSYKFGVGQRIPIEIVVNSGADESEVLLSIIGGSQYATLSNKVLTPTGKGTVRLRAESMHDSSVYNEVDVNIESVFGDADGNGSIDIADAVLLAQFLAGWSVSFSTGAEMDLTLDAAVDIGDAVMLAQYLAGWEVSFYTPKN